MNTQPCQDCSVIVMCISRGTYPHYVAMCSKCKGLYPVALTARNPDPIGRGYSAPVGMPLTPATESYDLISVGDQIHIPMRCPKDTLHYKQSRGAAAQRFICKACTEKLHDAMQVPKDWR